ncbi:hypothetical protein AB1N83_011999 [Pleurotus pulmonarius]
MGSFRPLFPSFLLSSTLSTHPLFHSFLSTPFQTLPSSHFLAFPHPLIPTHHHTPIALLSTISTQGLTQITQIAQIVQDRWRHLNVQRSTSEITDARPPPRARRPPRPPVRARSRRAPSPPATPSTKHPKHPKRTPPASVLRRGDGNRRGGGRRVGWEWSYAARWSSRGWSTTTAHPPGILHAPEYDIQVAVRNDWGNALAGPASMGRAVVTLQFSFGVASDLDTVIPVPVEESSGHTNIYDSEVIGRRRSDDWHSESAVPPPWAALLLAPFLILGSRIEYCTNRL